MQKDESLTVAWRPIDEIRPFPGNPRKISERAVAKVAASIQNYGWRQPIVVDESGEIIVGHTRHRAAANLGLTHVPVHVATGMTPQEVRAYRLADNRTHDEAEWDIPALELELKALSDIDFDLALTGFDQQDWPQEPNFDPSPEPTSKPLDHLTEFNCPACGHVFERGARR